MRQWLIHGFFDFVIAEDEDALRTFAQQYLADVTVEHKLNEETGRGGGIMCGSGGSCHYHEHETDEELADCKTRVNMDRETVG